MSKTINKAIDILETFLVYEHALSLSDVSRLTEINITTAYRILQTLSNRGLVSYDKKTSSYNLGLKLLELSYAIRKNLLFADVAHGPLNRLSQQKNVDLYISILDTSASLIIEEFGNTRDMRINSPVGKKLPLHCTATGKVLLASMSPKELKTFFKNPLPSFTRHTITDKEELKKAIEKVADEGVAYDIEEYKLGLCAASVPLYSGQGNIIAAIGCIDKKSNLPQDKLEEIAADMESCAAEISQIIARYGLY